MKVIIKYITYFINYSLQYTYTLYIMKIYNEALYTYICVLFFGRGEVVVNLWVQHWISIYHNLPIHSTVCEHLSYYNSFAIFQNTKILIMLLLSDFSVKVKIVNIFSFVSHMFFVIITQPCHCGEKALVDEWMPIWPVRQNVPTFVFG